MKKSKERRDRKKQVHITRIKKIERNKKNKHHKKGKRKKTQYNIDDAYIDNKVIKLLKNKKFDDQSMKIKNKDVIKIPEIFSFSDNVDETIKIIKKIYCACINPKIKKVKLDYSKCKILSLGASCITDVIILNVLEYRKKLNNPLHMTGTYPDMQTEAFEIFVISGLVNHLKIANLKNKNVKQLEMICNGEQSFVGEKVIKYYDECLSTKGYELTPKGKSELSKMITEVIDNAGNHAGELATWYTQGHYTIGERNEPGKVRLVLCNFGDTIYEGLKRVGSSKYTQKILTNASKKHKKKMLFGLNWNEEVLWNLFSLQYKISRCNYSKNNDRGVGTIDLIKSFLELGKTVEETKPIMSIVSGKSNIIFDGKYKIQTQNKKGFEIPTIAFNQNNSLFEKQDSKYVKVLKNSFPGTVIDMEFYIDKKYLGRLKENKK